MTLTRQFPARTVFTAASVAALTLLAGACGSSTPKANAKATVTTPTTASAPDPSESDYCLTARKWTVHELNGDGDTFADDPAAFEKYWGEYLDFIATASQQAPAEIRADWPIGHDFLVKQFTPVLAKYHFDIARLKAEGSPAELAVAKKMDAGPDAKAQRAQDAMHEYEGRVCQTAQPPAADVSFRGVKPNQAYCDAARAAGELAQQVNAKKWTVDAVRAFVTSPEFAARAAQAKANAPEEIKADVVADVDWQTGPQVDVLEKYGYDVRKLFLDGTAADRAIFQRSDPAVANHYARTVAYEEQVCGA